MPTGGDDLDLDRDPLVAVPEEQGGQDVGPPGADRSGVAVMVGVVPGDPVNEIEDRSGVLGGQGRRQQCHAVLGGFERHLPPGLRFLVAAGGRVGVEPADHSVDLAAPLGG
ncbi:hypothetical protein BCD49_29155 [Pseudofrankia sp. EUN1h]|nr:hypothetical protein BCD49_29155 [Pseudofrankia sp. EUN1h]